jgi:hypothetical protein
LLRMFRILWTHSNNNSSNNQSHANVTSPHCIFVSCRQHFSSCVSCANFCVHITCHHFQARGLGWQLLLLSYASNEWQFRVSHYGLFLGFELIFLSLWETFGGAITILVVSTLIATKYNYLFERHSEVWLRARIAIVVVLAPNEGAIKILASRRYRGCPSQQTTTTPVYSWETPRFLINGHC